MSDIRCGIALFACALLLAGCGVFGSGDEQKRAQRDDIARQLPKGCLFMDLGEYGRIDAVVAVICDGRKVVSTTTADRKSGKHVSYDRAAVFQIGEPRND